MIMGNHSKKEWLQWQLTETQSLLEQSKDSELMSLSLSYRIEDIKEQLKALENSDQKEAKIRFLFAGNAVLGSMGIKSSFANKTMASALGLIQIQSIYNSHGEEYIGKRGKLCKNNMGEIYLTGLPRGSFGFELSLMNEQDDWYAKDKVAQSMTEVIDIIQAAATNQEKYEEIIETHPSRMLVYLKDFFKELSAEQSILKMESGSNYVELSVSDNQNAYNRVSSTISDEIETKVFGIFKGAFVSSGKFEFQDEDGNIKHGKVCEDIDEEQITIYNRNFTNKKCVMIITEITVTFASREKTTYELMDIKETNN